MLLFFEYEAFCTDGANVKIKSLNDCPKDFLMGRRASIVKVRRCAFGWLSSLALPRAITKKEVDEEQYKVYDSKGQIMVGYDKVGFFYLLYFTAVPKSFENMQNSSDDVPVKHFYARVHEAPKRQTHVDYCEQGPPLRGRSIAVTRVVPLSCKICGLADEHAINNQVKADGEYESDSDYWE
ncbi:hypothetical protein PIB30_000377 [Stylosanthes scabra]|uniref:Uncharacterized protein n=1 Tax=Stylosanthes scabra TaxID=79078 RepID=A0ABU6U156_9FABA|nr:hypothetical protein [Stylosanthes scabra]